MNSNIQTQCCSFYKRNQFWACHKCTEIGYDGRSGRKQKWCIWPFLKQELTGLKCVISLFVVVKKNKLWNIKNVTKQTLWRHWWQLLLQMSPGHSECCASYPQSCCLWRQQRPHGGQHWSLYRSSAGSLTSHCLLVSPRSHSPHLVESRTLLRPSGSLHLLSGWTVLTCHHEWGWRQMAMVGNLHLRCSLPYTDWTQTRPSETSSRWRVRWTPFRSLSQHLSRRHSQVRFEWKVQRPLKAKFCLDQLH